MIDIELIRKTLINWYLSYKRTLPWRSTDNPYNIWVSEIILQQTRVNQGIDYYHRFLERFPDLKTLAAAKEEEVLKIWEGLGYYSRARNMHETARHIVKHLNGVFPQETQALEKLKGIGKYTAAAIASIAFNKPSAVVDGNVIRFITRLAGIEGSVNNTATLKQIHSLANELICTSSPGTFNQAMMEFGALQCIPGNPDCLKCIFSTTCHAFKNDKVSVLPYKSKKIRITERFFNYLVIECNNRENSGLVIKKRGEGDIWKHLYDFPLIEADKLLNRQQLKQNKTFLSLMNGLSTKVVAYEKDYRHQLTHRLVKARFFKVIPGNPDLLKFPAGYLCTGNTGKYPMPKLINLFIHENRNH